ncbi:SGNH/GDSL hydrolase family protein [Pleionea sediminis]|uniref:SGNH/GDSL hydrolase family protein n=1 Tax=Pleionea sediminis TaxID=2569479 RepID=UPI0013DE7974|nr:SGNH/GDSL hydrolase family protein [Pleionea sediminis]
MNIILCFGDSLVFGEHDVEKGGWVDRLKVDAFKSYLSNKSELSSKNGEADNRSQTYLPTRTYNLGIAGETTDGLVARLESELTARFVRGQRHHVILAYGLNDIVIHKNKNRVPLEIFVRHMQRAIDVIKEKSCEPLLMTMPIIPDEMSGQVNCHGQIRQQEDSVIFNQALLELTESNQVQCIDVSSFLGREEQKDGSIWAADGVHLTAEAHRFIYKGIRAAFSDWFDNH